MLFAVICTDKPNNEVVRLDNRPAHLNWLKNGPLEVPLAGPLHDDTGTRMIGSLLVVEAEDRRALDAGLAEDPYALADLFADVRIQPWTWAIGRPDGV